ncbi:MAG: 16S rRNA (guanine(527)-N(7))-methyltransferase RsmG [Robiginitomaculum sp.]|nr:MAG: 16S rRNA (guanine(527)-N(7))-methyltransferase RsmG [Robiginitomaculum sp.]
MIAAKTSETYAKQQVSNIVSRETMERFEQIHRALVQWSRRFNLVAPSTLPQFWSRHVFDSVQLLDLAPKTTKNWLDFGSGAGFPGLILAILLRDRPGAKVKLIESVGKKTAFLQHCARITDAPAIVLQQRVEQVPAECAEVITARALAGVSDLLVLCERFTGPQTVLLFPKGKNLEQELTIARKEWDIEAEILPSITDEQAGILRIRKFHRV